VKLPSVMAAMETDLNGEGLGVEQLIRRAANHVLPYGRCGFLADYPRTKGQVTQADVEAGVRPVVRFFEPWAVINWKVEKVGDVKKLVLLVLKEAYEDNEEDEFSIQIKHRHRVYRLKDNEVSVQLYKENTKDGEPILLKSASGEALKEIPFQFAGSENNDSEIDQPPLYSMASLNVAHYRNSADYEESVFLVGQPTPVYSGLTADWVDNYFKKGVPFGSRASVPLPENAEAKLLQAQPNTLAFEAMRQKESQMIAIGAKLINPKSTVERKEAEIQIEAASQKSVLTTIKDNLQNAMLSCLIQAASFANANPQEIELELNDNFDLTSLTGEELRWLLELFNNSTLSFDEFHENLRRSGIVKTTADEARKAIKADVEFRKATTIVPPTVGTPKPKPPEEE